VTLFLNIYIRKISLDSYGKRIKEFKPKLELFHLVKRSKIFKAIFLLFFNKNVLSNRYRTKNSLIDETREI
ncbi:MAG: hypothetical protein ACFFDI_21830, partial [Promethearchaeota archaeon]